MTYTTIEQSKALVNLGLDEKIADMYYQLTEDTVENWEVHLGKMGSISFETDTLHDDIDLDVLYDPFYKPNNNVLKGIALVQQALDKARDLANTIEGALAGKEPYPDTYYRMCQDIIECLTKIKKIV